MRLGRFDAKGGSQRFPPAIRALAVCFFAFGTGEFVVAGLLLEIAQDLGVSTSRAGSLIGGYAIGVIVGALVAPQLIRRVPAKSALIGLMLLLVVGDVLCALAVDFRMLLAARFVAGLAQAAFFGLASSIAAGAVAEHRRASAIAAVFTGVTLANLLGVPAGTVLGQELGWRTTFWAIAASGAIAIGALFRLMPTVSHDEPPAIAKQLGALRDPALLLAFASTILAEGAILTVFTYISPILVEITGLRPAAVGPVLLLFGLGFVTGNALGGRLADRRLMPALIGLVAALAGVLAAFAVTSHAAVPALLTVFLFGATAFAVVPGLQLRVVETAGAATTLAPALNIAAFNVGNAGGARLGSAVIDGPLGLSAVPWVGALVALAGLAVTVAGWLGDRRHSARRTVSHA